MTTTIETQPAIADPSAESISITKTLQPIYMRLFALQSSLKCAVSSAMSSGDEITANAFEAIGMIGELLGDEAEKIERLANENKQF